MDNNILFNKIANYNGLIFFLQFLEENNNSINILDKDDQEIFDNFLNYYVFDGKMKNTPLIYSNTSLIYSNTSLTFSDISIDEKRKFLIIQNKEITNNIINSFRFYIHDLCIKYNKFCTNKYDVSFNTELYLNIIHFFDNINFKEYNISFTSDVIKNMIKQLFDESISKFSNYTQNDDKDDVEKLILCLYAIYDLIDEIYNIKEINNLLNVLFENLDNRIDRIFKLNVDNKCYDNINLLKNTIITTMKTFFKEKQKIFNKNINNISNFKTDIITQIQYILSYKTNYTFVKTNLLSFSANFQKIIDSFISNSSFMDGLLSENITLLKTKILNYYEDLCVNIEINHIDIIIKNFQFDISNLLNNIQISSDTDVFILQADSKDVIYQYIEQIKTYYKYDIILAIFREYDIIKNIYYQIKSPETDLINLIRKLYNFLPFNPEIIINIFIDEYNNYLKKIDDTIEECYIDILLKINKLKFNNSNISSSDIFFQSINTYINDLQNKLINLVEDINDYFIDAKNRLAINIQKYLDHLNLEFIKLLNNSLATDIDTIYEKYNNSNKNIKPYINIVDFYCDMSEYLNLDPIKNYCIELSKLIQFINYFLYSDSKSSINNIKLIFMFFLKSDISLNREYNSYNFIKYLSQFNSILNQKIDSLYGIDSLITSYNNKYEIINKNEFKYPTKINTFKKKLMIYFLKYIDIDYHYSNYYSYIYKYNNSSLSNLDKQYLISNISDYFNYLSINSHILDLDINYYSKNTENTIIYANNKTCLIDNILFFKFFTCTNKLNTLLNSKMVNQFIVEDYVIKIIIPLFSTLTNNMKINTPINLKYYDMFKIIIKT